MKSWKSGVSKLVLALIVVVSFFSFQSSTYAATLYKPLTSPDSGWQRYDAQNSYIAYVGASWSDGAWSGCWAGTLKSTKTVGNKAVINFYGTKFRIIDPMNPNRSTAIKISVDGVNDVFTEYVASPIDPALVYEKTGLAPGVHTVVITLTENKMMAFDAFDIDSTGYLIDSNVSAPTNLAATAGIGKVDLGWKAVSNAVSYSVKRSVTSGGPYETIASDVTTATYTDVNVVPNTTYYYAVSAASSTIESVNSNEVSATPLAPVIGRAILTIYLTNGIEKEYDLSMSEVNAFIDWYDQKDAGVGPAKYAFIKTWNKGPFNKRTEYVVFDKILTFNVDEYAAEE